MSGKFSHKNGKSEVYGDFSGLEKLAEGLSKKHYVDIGILGETNQTEEGGITLAGIGAVHQFGSPEQGISERDWLVQPIIDAQGQIEKSVEKKIEGLLAEGKVDEIFKIIGVSAEASVKEAFETGGNGKWAPLKEETIERKGSDTILVDEGDLRDAVTSKVGKK